MGFFLGSLIRMQSVHLLYLHFQVLVFSIIIFEIMRILCINEKSWSLTCAVSIINFFFALHLSFLALISEITSLHSELPPALSGCITMALIRIYAHLKLEDAVCLILFLAKLGVFYHRPCGKILNNCKRSWFWRRAEFVWKYHLRWNVGGPQPSVTWREDNCILQK